MNTSSPAALSAPRLRALASPQLWERVISFARQGYVYPVYLRISAGNDGAQRVLATPNIDDKRYDTVWTADFRLANKLKLGGRSSADITLDLFNAFNNNMILGRNRQANASAFGTPTDVLSPRILRLGLRLNF